MIGVGKADRDVRVVRPGPGVTILLPGLSEKAGATLLVRRFPPAFFPNQAGHGYPVYDSGSGILMNPVLDPIDNPR